MELQEDEEMDEVLMDSLDEIYLVHSSSCDFSDSHQAPKSSASLSEEHVVYSTLDAASEYISYKTKFPSVFPGSLPIP